MARIEPANEMSATGKSIKSGLTAAMIIAITVGIGACATVPSSTPPIVRPDGTVRTGSLSTIETVTLGGVEQTITIRGTDASNPVLLHLHGGPGLPSSPWASWRETYTILEENFVLVHWDQRGSGKSYHSELTADEMHMENFVSDALELSEMLRKRFGGRKIFLWGHSWGAGLGFEVLRADESPFAAYFASGVRPRWDASQIAGYEQLIDLARDRGDEDAVAELEALAPFDPANPEHLEVRARYLSYFNVGDFHTEGLEAEWLGYAQRGRSPEYPRHTIAGILAGMSFTRETIGTEILKIGFDLYRDYPGSSIPVHFFAGRYDFETPGELAYDYYEALCAPEKSFTWFERSAHDVFFDEPEAFSRALVEIAGEIAKEGLR